MSVKVKVSQTALEQCICDFCSCYTNVSPIRMVSDKIACGRCPGEGVELFILESLLQNVDFPCRYKSLGCEVLLKWNEAIDHESECKYRRYKCIVTGCDWIGEYSIYHIHIRNTHTEQIIIPRQNFEIDLRNNQTYNYLYLDGDRVFLITLSTSSKEIEYCVQAFCVKSKLSDYEYNVVIAQNEVSLTYHRQTLLMIQDQQHPQYKKIERAQLEKVFDINKLVNTSITIIIEGNTPPPTKFYQIIDNFKCQECHLNIYPYNTIYGCSGQHYSYTGGFVDTFMKELLIKLYNRPLLLHDILSSAVCAFCGKNTLYEKNIFKADYESGICCESCGISSMKPAHTYVELRNNLITLFNKI